MSHRDKLFVENTNHKNIEGPKERPVYLHKQKYSLIFQQTYLKGYIEILTT